MDDFFEDEDGFENDEDGAQADPDDPSPEEVSMIYALLFAEALEGHLRFPLPLPEFEVVILRCVEQYGKLLELRQRFRDGAFADDAS